MKRLCIFYKFADKWLGKKIEWIVCKACQKRLLKGEVLLPNYAWCECVFLPETHRERECETQESRERWFFEHPKQKESRKIPIAVIAGNLEQYRNYLRENKFADWKDCFYVNVEDALRGRVIDKVVYYGTYYSRRDIHILRDLVQVVIKNACAKCGSTERREEGDCPAGRWWWCCVGCGARIN